MGAGWLALVQQKTTREIEIGKFITHRSRRKQGAHLAGRSRQAQQREWENLVPVPM